MAKRKTVPVVDLVEQANLMLKVSTCEPAVRQGIINFIEHFLHETGNYQGFRYLMEDEVPEGEKPGVRYGRDERGMLMPLEYTERFKDTDQTRVQY